MSRQHNFSVSSKLDTLNFPGNKKFRTELKSNYRTTVKLIFAAKIFCLSTRGKLSCYAIWQNINCHAMQFSRIVFTNSPNLLQLNSVVKQKQIEKDKMSSGSTSQRLFRLILTIVSVSLLTVFPVRAASLSLSEIPVGTILQIGSQSYVKLNSTNLLAQLSNYSCPDGARVAGDWVECHHCRSNAIGYDKTTGHCSCPSGTTYNATENECQTFQGDFDLSKVQVYGCTDPIGTMQAWTGCAGAATPDYGTTDYSLDVCLVDERDGKTYEVRKFADGKCWMVTNLAYGGDTINGGTDGCWGVNSSYSGATSVATATTNRFGSGTYGNCRAAWNTTGTTVDMSQDVNMYGYHYDWAAAIQDPYGFYGNSNASAFSYNAGSSTSGNTGEIRKGICPNGWHLPTGNTGGEYQLLHLATGSPGTGFYQGVWTGGPATKAGATYTGGNWIGVYSDRANTNGSLGTQGTGSYGLWWTSTYYSSQSAYSFEFTNSQAGPLDHYYQHVGRSVRCIKD